MAIIREVFENILKSTKILGIKDDFTNEVETALGKLLPFKTGSQGELLEWYEEQEAQSKCRDRYGEPDGKIFFGQVERLG